MHFVIFVLYPDSSICTESRITAPLLMHYSVNTDYVEIAKFVKKTTGILPAHICTDRMVGFGEPRIKVLGSNSKEAAKLHRKLVSDLKKHHTFKHKVFKTGYVPSTQTQHSVNRVRICGLPSDVTRKAILEHIQKKGKIQMTLKKIYLQQHNVSPKEKINAIVRCNSKDDAKTLVKSLNMEPLQNTNHILYVQKMITSPKAFSEALVISNFTAKVTPQDLADIMYKNAGINDPPKAIWMSPEDKQEKRKGVAIVEFANIQDADKVGKLFNFRNVKGRYLSIEHIPMERWNAAGFKRNLDNTKLKGAKRKTVLLQNIHISVTRDKVRDLCAKYGKVKNVMRNGHRYHVTMDRDKEAKAAVEGLHGEKFVANYDIIASFPPREKGPNKSVLTKSQKKKKKVKVKVTQLKGVKKKGVNKGDLSKVMKNMIKLTIAGEGKGKGKGNKLSNAPKKNKKLKEKVKGKAKESKKEGPKRAKKKKKLKLKGLVNSLAKMGV